MNGAVRAAACVAGAVVVGACGSAGADRVLTVDATGTVGAFVYFDQNGTRQFDDNIDRRLPGVRVRVALAGSGTVVAEATSDMDGQLRMSGVPVGDYVVVVDSTTVGDSVQVVRIDTSAVRVDPEDSVGVTVAISFPTFTVAETRALPTADRIFVTAVALSPLAAFGDSTVHLRDATGTIRATRVVGNVVPGDSGRFLGRRSTFDGQPTLDGVTVFSLGSVGQPQSEQATTIAAATADGGRLDAGLVRVPVAMIVDTMTSPGGDYVMRADDGTGAVEVIVDVSLGIVLTRLVPGASIDVTGVLVPTNPGVPRWGIKPRSNADLRVL